ncbi:putative chromatin remodeling & transcriptional activation HMG family [Helianthus annuus]|nr:putative chromatin remodeling & transcriptional activation HMG family [Helianthus annuus]
MTTATAENEKKEEVKGGELLFCGVTEWDDVGRRKGSSELNLVSPTRLRPLVGVDIRYVAAGCAAVHCVALDVDGRCFTWGRNDGQLGHGDRVRRDMPTIVSALASYKVVKAGSGKSHTVIATEDGLSFSFGWNKHGQLGTGSAKKEFELDPVRCLVTEVTKVACGADFTVWLTSVEGASILTAGLPQYGQLGHGSDMEYNTKDSSVKLAYEAQPRPTAIASFADETIVNVACGSNHTVAVDSKGYVYTWGFGGYGRLGHREQKDEFTPRRVDVFTKHNVLPPGAILSAGSANSAVTAGAGQMYMWGKIKNTGDDLMYPKPLMDLSGWNVRCMDSGYMHHFVGAESSCISWGQCHSGELGYGPHQQKSSAIPKKVDALEDMHVISVACGFAHSLVVVDRTNAGDQLDQLEIYDGEGGKAAGRGRGRGRPPAAKNIQQEEKRAAAAAKTSNKRKKSKEASDPEDEEENNEEDDDDSDPEANAVAETKSKRGGKASGRGRGRGRPAAAKKEDSGAASAKRGRGRPKKA